MAIRKNTQTLCRRTYRISWKNTLQNKAAFKNRLENPRRIYTNGFYEYYF
jgi:hypothetical protein